MDFVGRHHDWGNLCQLRVKIISALVRGGGLPNDSRVEIYFNDILYDSTPTCAPQSSGSASKITSAEYIWNKTYSKMLDKSKIEGDEPIVISFILWKKRWTSSGFKSVGKHSISLSELKGQIGQAAQKRIIKFDGFILKGEMSVEIEVTHLKKQENSAIIQEIENKHTVEFRRKSVTASNVVENKYVHLELDCEEYLNKARSRIKHGKINEKDKSKLKTDTSSDRNYMPNTSEALQSRLKSATNDIHDKIHELIHFSSRMEYELNEAGHNLQGCLGYCREKSIKILSQSVAIAESVAVITAVEKSLTDMKLFSEESKKIEDEIFVPFFERETSDKIVSDEIFEETNVSINTRLSVLEKMKETLSEKEENLKSLEMDQNTLQMECAQLVSTIQYFLMDFRLIKAKSTALHVTMDNFDEESEDERSGSEEGTFEEEEEESSAKISTNIQSLEFRDDEKKEYKYKHSPTCNDCHETIQETQEILDKMKNIATLVENLHNKSKRIASLEEKIKKIGKSVEK